ncbi:hypothetical protein AVEN_55771-1 [Araneus ventricosus]|uniref:Uncharacterized protein n=1 Tax=Araneus ventricosus TaxID=182803 RepID=A0A4Y2EW05_ARAVE|nr:hypothetical protein AVEN_55771-1 [Araneus ventricosus]
MTAKRKNVSVCGKRKETSTQRKRRLEKKRQKYRESRAAEDEQTKCSKLEARRERKRTEANDKRESRLEACRQYMASRRATEKLEARTARLDSMRRYISQVRAAETIEARNARLDTMRQRMSQLRAEETCSERILRLDAYYLGYARTIAEETHGKHDIRVEYIRHQRKGLFAVITIIDTHNHSLNTVEALKFLPASDCKEKFLEYFNDGMGVTKACRFHEGILQLEDKFTEEDMANPQINPPYRSVQYWYDQWRLQNLGPRTGLRSLESSGTSSREEEKNKDHIPLEPTIEIKEEPLDYNPTPSTSTDAANEEFILPHEENTWTPPDPVVEPQFTLSVASLASSNDPETSESEQVRKKRKVKTSTFVPSTNGPELRQQSPVYNFGEVSNPGSSKEPRKDQFDVFGEYIAAKLRSLDRRSCSYAQKAIGDIIFEAEMGKYLNMDSESKDLKNCAS